MTGYYNTISISDVISRAKMSLRLNTSENDLFLEVLGREALGSLSALSQLSKKQCCLTFEGQSAKLPDDFVRYLAFKVDIENTATNNPITDQILNGCQMFLYADANFLEECGCNSNGALGWTTGGFQITDGYLHFNSSNTIASNTLAYMGLNLDDKGKPVVYERYERAVAAYMCYKYAMSFSEDFNQYVINEYKKEWTAQKSLMVGRDAARSFQNEKREIQNMWNAMLVSRIVNYNV